MNMVFIFGGIMVSIFIGHDYRSGYVKQLFTTHAKKRDYMFSKTLSCAFAMACMCLTYLLGTVFAGALVGASMAVDPAGLLFALLGKLVMSLGWAGLYAFLNILFRRQFGVSIALSFFFGTGLPVISAGAEGGGSPVVNVVLYVVSRFACLCAGSATVLGCLAVSLGWAIFYNLLGCAVLARSDVY
ncbi:MAG: hypothetical protein LIO42_01990 [Oscillospiraceae bacterium]|nr:hypothetical protein [Oscillospiraceae bacterium]